MQINSICNGSVLELSSSMYIEVIRTVLAPQKNPTTKIGNIHKDFKLYQVYIHNTGQQKKNLSSAGFCLRCF